MSRAIVVVPCYNEARRLDPRRFEAFGRRAQRAELLLVNDGSRDETLEVLERLHQANPRRFSFLHLAKNSGKAEAVRQGVLLAMRSGADYVGYWDADLATPLEDIESFSRVLDDKPAIDVVVGTRLSLLGHQVQRQKLRRLLGRAFAQAASLALGVRILDTQCGAKMFRVTPRIAPLFEHEFLSRWIFDVEILARLARSGRGTNLPSLTDSVYEFPLDQWHDVAGSRLKRSDFFKAAFELGVIYLRYLRPGAPPLPAVHTPSYSGGRTSFGDQQAA